jgi:hypothetical protein
MPGYRFAVLVDARSFLPRAVIPSPEARLPSCVRQRAAKGRPRSDFGRPEPFTIPLARCHGPKAVSIETGAERAADNFNSQQKARDVEARLGLESASDGSSFRRFESARLGLWKRRDDRVRSSRDSAPRLRPSNSRRRSGRRTPSPAAGSANQRAVFQHFRARGAWGIRIPSGKWRLQEAGRSCSPERPRRQSWRTGPYRL